MPDPIKTQVRAAIETAVGDITTANGKTYTLNVIDARAWPPPHVDLNTVVVPVTAERDPQTHSKATWNGVFIVAVDVAIPTSGDWFDKVDVIEADIYAAIETDIQLGGTAVLAQVTDSVFEVSQRRLQIEVSVNYRHAVANAYQA